MQNIHGAELELCFGDVRNSTDLKADTCNINGLPHNAGVTNDEGTADFMNLFFGYSFCSYFGAYPGGVAHRNSQDGFGFCHSRLFFLQTAVLAYFESGHLLFYLLGLFGSGLIQWWQNCCSAEAEFVHNDFEGSQ